VYLSPKRELQSTPAATQTAPDRAVDIGVAILVTTHAGYHPDWLRNALQSVESALTTAGHRNAMLFVAVDDAITPAGRTIVRIARAHVSTARRVVVQGFPKARNLSTAKNRALRLYLPFAPECPWVSWLDGDDLALPGRFRWLLPQLVASGARIGGGEYLLESKDHFISTVGVGRIQDHWHAGIWSVIFHHSLIPFDGRLFDESVSDDFFDDPFVWARWEHAGEPVLWFPGDPTTHVHNHPSSFCVTRPGGWNAACQRTHAEVFRRYPRRQLYHDHVVFAAWGDICLSETRLAVTSFALANHLNPPGSITLYAPTPDHPRIRSWAEGLELNCPLRTAPIEPFLAKAYGAREFISIHDPQYRAMCQACFTKWLVIRHHNAAGPSLYFDGDFVFLRPIALLPWARFACSAELTPPIERSDWSKSAYGFLNGGVIKLAWAADPLVNLILDSMLQLCPDWANPNLGSIGNAPAEGWADQGVMSLLPESLHGDLAYWQPGIFPNVTCSSEGLLSHLDHSAAGSDFIRAMAHATNISPFLDPHELLCRARLVQAAHVHLYNHHQFWTAWPRFISQIIHAQLANGAFSHLLPIRNLIPLIS
jgi:hypothetical protein